MKNNGSTARSESLYIYIVSPLIVFLWFCLAMPVGIAPYTGGIFSKSGILVGFAESLFPAVVTALIAGIPVLSIKNKFGIICTSALWAIAMLLGWFSVVVEYFVGLGLHCRFNEAVLLLILQSDSGESGEFINYALGLPATWKALAASAVPVIPALAMLILRRPLFGFRHFFKVAAALTAASACVFAVAHKPVIEDSFDSKRQSYMTSPFQIPVSMRPLSDNTKQISRITAANEAITVSRAGEDAPKIVVIIGESDNKYHSSLYGYRLVQQVP